MLRILLPLRASAGLLAGASAVAGALTPVRALDLAASAHREVRPALLAGVVVQSSPDSARLLDRARDAQARFERTRRRYLSQEVSGGGSGCDDEVGRMCWRHDTGGPWNPEPEDERTVEAREALLAELAEIGRQIPGDAWVLGQRVYYLGDAGRWDEAGRLASRCPGAPAQPSWWCPALVGLALHVQGFYLEAEASFDRALAQMPDERRKAWTDVEVLLDGDVRDVLEDAREYDEGGARDSTSAVLERLWSLADPLHVVQGNDRWTEHLARRTMVEIRRDARTPYGITWGSDMAELLVRYGWGVGWTEVAPGPNSILSVGGVSGHEHPESRHYLPPARVVSDPASVEPGSWEAGLAYARSAYAPRHAPVVLPGEGVVHAFPRGDRVLLHAAYRMPTDTTYRGRHGVRDEHEPPRAFEAVRFPEAGLFVTSESGVERRTLARGAEGHLTLDVPPGRYRVSLEVWDPVRGFAGRVRHGLDLPVVPPDLLTLSDLLLLDEDPEPETLEEAVRGLRADHRVASGSTLRVGWEVWGLGWRPEPLAYRLSLVEPDGGLLRRAGRLFGLVGEPEELALEWEERGPDRPGPVFRSVVLDLPELEPGVYHLELTLETDGRDTAVARRLVQVVSPGAR